ncbi:2-oxoglutarate-dependent dioxygenase AOP2-like isoform X1 [Zingiber officinale]|uniref:2-oxoglutarate-dependent dioxygenase AOP2-like isoform X1 n=1 Tax=Zingiber officinale TaxID=94328 RepID=UPI001C4DD833|nr:2-oxoglutarate-dependent dioxygenase AOP2-like isoform X1 [Zingiber officinale]
MASEAAPGQLPYKIDFSGIGLADRGSPAWTAVRTQVMHAMVTVGCFEAVYDRVSPHLRDSLLRMVSQELFPLPREVKIKNSSARVYGGYIGQIPGHAYESLAITFTCANDAASVDNFFSLLWPDGNPRFSETTLSFVTKLVELEEMVRGMVWEGLGVAKYQVEPSESTLYYMIRFAKYGEEKELEAEENGEEVKLAGYGAHRDTNAFSVVCQLNEVDALEVEIGDNEEEWVSAKPTSPASFFVLAGNAIRAWTNGRVRAAPHRITVGDQNLIRYAAILFSVPQDDYVIQAPAELVDNAHPSLFNPYKYGDFLGFLLTEEGVKAEDKLTPYRRVVA